MTMDQQRLMEVMKTTIEGDSGTEIQVGISDLPNESPTLPYCILDGLGVREFEGQYNTPEDTGTWTVQVRTLGETTEQVGRVQSAVRALMLGRTGSGWANSLAVEGEEPQGRMADSLGAIVQADTELWQSTDRYQFKRSMA